MSKSMHDLKGYRCLRGVLSGVSNDGRFGFVNDPVRINGYQGEVPRTVFFHKRLLPEVKALRDGMRVDLNFWESTHEAHPDTYEARNARLLDVLELSEDASSEIVVPSNRPDPKSWINVAEQI